MNPEFTMCNYYGMCDSKGNAVGHTVKVTNEYSDILKGRFDIKLAASPCIVSECNISNFKDVRALKYNTCINDGKILSRIFDKVKLLYNIHQAINGNGIYFFYQVDFFFFFYIKYFYKVKKKRKILCLIYHQDFTGGRLWPVLQYIYRKALKKIDGVIYTQIDTPIPHNNTMWIPDFFYSDNQYVKYRELEKIERVACVGTMNRYKQLEELVEAFSHTSMQLVIAGRFDDAERYQQLADKKTDNVIIWDINLSYDEYMELLATSKYSILPYDMEQYKNRTSGVLLESIYVGSIPVAPENLLKQNHLPGISYKKISDLFENMNLLNGLEEFDFQAVYDKNDKDNFIDFLRQWIEKLN